jgi:alpha-mannosidase
VEPLPTTAGFLENDEPRIILAAWKGAQDGRGAILRFYNTSASAAAAHLRFPHLRFQEAIWTNAVERDEGTAGVSGEQLSLSLKPHEIRTVRLVGLALDREK